MSSPTDSISSGEFYPPHVARLDWGIPARVSRYLKSHGLRPRNVLYNASVPALYEAALKHERGSAITSTGALVAYSGKKTGRSPSDKRIVCNEETRDEVWWGEGSPNIEMSEDSFCICRERALNYLSTKDLLYVFDGFAGADPRYRIKVRVITSRAYHALFMHNMLIRPTARELDDFGDPEWTIFNAGAFPANRYTHNLTSSTSVSIHLEDQQMVVLGTMYAGEMKKGVFTIMHYLMPGRGVLSLHSSANMSKEGDVSLFFGLSGTGKTTLSADPQRRLIGDDEHCWTDDGVFNIEGGCYAKAINLSPEGEPEIYNAIRFGAVLENVVFDYRTREVDYDDVSITENTRCSYPIDYIPGAVVPSQGGHPSHIILLTCDAFGVLPPVSKLTPEQVMYHFISGYTAKVAGTEVGIKEPQATFSACFGAPFLVRHPTVYAEMLAKKMRDHSASAWLVNTGWSGGGFGVGKRMKLAYSRAIIDAIHSGELDAAEYETYPVFNLHVPKTCTNVPDKVLNPKNTWPDKAAFEAARASLAERFVHNFHTYEAEAAPEIMNAGPTL